VTRFYGRDLSAFRLVGIAAVVAKNRKCGRAEFAMQCGKEICNAAQLATLEPVSDIRLEEFDPSKNEFS